MTRNWKVDEERAVEVDLRHLKMQSALTIRSVVDALVELITNSDDAYGTDKGKIVVEVTRRRGETVGEVLVKDRAGGMTVQEMNQKILRYGAFGASEKARGFMGRGAKDIVALGIAAFESIKDGKVHCVQISPEFDAKVMKSIRATQKDYEEFGIKPGKGGVRVTLQVSKAGKVPQHETLLRDLQRHYALRDILRRREVRLCDGRRGREEVVTYTQPAGEMVMEESHSFDPPYEGAKARLILFQSPVELSTDLSEGIIVCDEKAVHEVTRLAPDLDQDPIGRRFFGRLECEHIRKLQLEYESFRSRSETPPDWNSVDIVDPNRRTGLDRSDHPFVKKLFSWAEALLRKEVDRLRAEERRESQAQPTDETKRRLKELSRVVADHLKERIEGEALGPRTPEEASALFQEGVLLNPQFEKLQVGEKRQLAYTVVSFGDADDPKKVTVSHDVDAIRVTPERPSLRRQRRDPERLTAYFEVEGIKPCPLVTLTVQYGSDLILPVSRHLEVVETEDPYKHFPYGVAFEKQRYTVHHNGQRTLRFVAKGRKYRKVDWTETTLLESSDPDSVVILRGNIPKVEVIDHDIWRGDVLVKGYGVGKHATISLSVPTTDGKEITTARVEVSELEEDPEVGVEIVIVPESGGQWRASWDKSRRNRLNIYGGHPVLSRYRGTEQDGFPGEKQAHFKVLIAEIVAEKVVQRILEQRIEANPRMYEEPNKLFFAYSEELTAFLPMAHRIMLSESEARRVLEEGKSSKTP